MAQTHRFKNLYHVPHQRLGFFQTLKALYRIFNPSWHDIPRHGIPECTPDIAQLNALNDGLSFIWLGHSSVLVRCEGQTILFDPMFSTYASPIVGTIKRFQPPALTLTQLPHIDTIVISHDHYDHLDKQTIRFFKDKTCHFVVPLGIKRYLMRWGIDEGRITELHWYEEHRIGELQYIATPAHHFSGRTLFSHNTTLWASWVIQSPKHRLFFSGDSAYSPHFKEIGERFGAFDIAFMENGQYHDSWRYAHMMPEESIQAVLDINAKLFVPIHWSMFRLSTHHWLEPMMRSLQLTEKNNLPILCPFLGELVQVKL